MAKTETFVLASQIAAQLHFAAKVAEQLSLTAKNAHAISARAGQQASGFRAITSFIEDLAVTTISQANHISLQTTAIATLATNRKRTLMALQHFTRVRQTASDAAHISSIDTPAFQTQEKLNALEKDFRDQLWQLELQLEEIQQQIRGAAIISSTSKVEASQAGSFKTQLEVIAQNIADAAERIKQHLRQAHTLLMEASSTS